MRYFIIEMYYAEQYVCCVVVELSLKIGHGFPMTSLSFYLVRLHNQIVLPAVPKAVGLFACGFI
jgi:hypothetical protein